MDPSLNPESVRASIESRTLRTLRDQLVTHTPVELADLIKELSGEEQGIVFRILPRELAADTFENLALEDQKLMLSTLGSERFGVILNNMDPDDRTALLEEFPAPAARQLVSLLSKDERTTALSLLGYPEDSVGRLMNPEYIAASPNWTVSQVLQQVRTYGQDRDSFDVLYVVDDRGLLVDDLRLRRLLLAAPDSSISELLDYRPISLKATDDQETAVAVFRKYDRSALPVVDSYGHMLGILTVDDVLDVAEEEATEDIQKLGAVEALEAPYIRVPLATLIRKRAGWLVILFIGEMLTATAMGYYESEIQQAVVLALFVPLIISSGGNSGSQAATLVIRALALGEIKVGDWPRVLRRELVSGLSLGAILGLIGVLRITVWSLFGDAYGPHWQLVSVAVGVSLLAVVVWGTLSGSLLPLLLKRLGFDPATSSAPFVATLVDVTGLVVYFSVAHFVLSGTLL